jgi:hypothetical protein
VVVAALTKLAKGTAALSGALTAVCAVASTALQVAAGLRDGVWEPHRLSWVLEHLRDSHPTYTTASVTPDEIGRLLDVPVVAILAAAIVAHLLLYSFLVEFEKRIPS